MIAKILAYVQKYRMIEENDTIVAGVSGGADSVCLLFVLLRIRKDIPFHLAAAHVNHGIRRDAGEDAAYVKKLCEENNLPFYLTEVQVREYALLNGLSEEEAGRELRYKAFEEALACEQAKAEGGYFKGKIAVAHNSNDRAETMLFHLFRGTGLPGLVGIKPVNDKIIRPLLCAERREIEEWIDKQGIAYKTDSTNEQDVYTRNRIRHHILPYAEENVCKGAVFHMNRAADNLEEAEGFLKKQTLLGKEKCVSPDKEGVIQIDIPVFLSEDSYLQGRILLSCLEDVTEGRKNIASVHIDSIRKLFQGGGSREIHLPGNIIVYKKYDVGMIEKSGEKKRKNGALEDRSQICYEVPIPGTIAVPKLGNVEISVFSYEKAENIPQKTYTKWFDYDKITTSIAFRVRKKGDFLTINNRMDHKSLKDYFINEKIPKEERDSCYILADGSHIMWIPGYRISEYYKISEETRSILQVRINKEVVT